MTREQWGKVLTGAGLAAAGAFLGFLSDLAADQQLGGWSAVVGAVASTGLNLLRKYAKQDAPAKPAE